MGVGELDGRDIVLADLLSHDDGRKESEVTHARVRLPEQNRESSMLRQITDFGV
jgi:hypothetical protein